jgi:NADPH:quinone reductase-like Zn-dependent oxidoreductase
MHRPTILASLLRTSEQGKKILIWSGSSAMGSLSISHAKAAGHIVINTSSPHNFDFLRSCGADHVFDHNDPATINAIRDLLLIDYWFDTIALKPSLSTLIKILAPEREPVNKANILILLPHVMTDLKTKDFPEGVTTQFHRISTHAPENADWQEHFLARGSFLKQAIKSGVLKGVPAEVVSGLDSVAGAIEKVYDGVSGKKIVVEPWA